VTARDVKRATALHGSLRVPGDKSASHRALMLSALADGESTIEGLSPGHDVASTSAIVEQLGATRVDGLGLVTVVGPAGGLRASARELDCANSGTSMRLLAGLVSGIEGVHALVGDESLSRRPMDRVALPLRLMGATIHGQGSQITAPLRIEGSSSLRGIDYQVPVASAQVKSAILLAGLGASGPTSVHEDVLTRTTTEDMLRRAGLDVRSLIEREGCTITLSPGRPRPMSWRIPGDPSQAAFFAVLGALHDCAVVEVLDVDASPQRSGFVGVLERMGARLTRVVGENGVSLVSQSSQLEATEVYSSEIPSVDEVPVLAVAAAAATGVSAFCDMAELRVKESDRFSGSMELARSLGCRVWDEGDDFFIEGLGSATAFHAFRFDAGLDHRMVMAGAVAGVAGAGCSIGGADTVATSYPDFFDDLAALYE
jgi:3-phosphoshikimate 1-carboxyvinyltransferase